MCPRTCNFCHNDGTISHYVRSETVRYCLCVSKGLETREKRKRIPTLTQSVLFFQIQFFRNFQNLHYWHFCTTSKVNHLQEVRFQSNKFRHKFRKMSVPTSGVSKNLYRLIYFVNVYKKYLFLMDLTFGLSDSKALAVCILECKDDNRLREYCQSWKEAGLCTDIAVQIKCAITCEASCAAGMGRKWLVPETIITVPGRHGCDMFHKRIWCGRIIMPNLLN